MECASASGPLVSEQKYTEKQKKLIEECDLVISKEGIKVYIDTAPSEFGDPISVDVEHDECGNMVGIGVCDGLDCRYYTVIDEPLRLRLTTCQLIMHNGVSDIECLRMWGINVQDNQLVWDTMLISHLLDSSKKDFGLKACAKRELGIEYPSYDDIVGKRGLKAERVTLDKQPLELVAAYNALDTYCTWKLYERQKKAIGI